MLDSVKIKIQTHHNTTEVYNYKNVKNVYFEEKFVKIARPDSVICFNNDNVIKIDWSKQGK